MMVLQHKPQHSSMSWSVRCSPALPCQLPFHPPRQRPAQPHQRTLSKTRQALKASTPDSSSDSSSNSSSTQLQRVLQVQQLLLGSTSTSGAAPQEPSGPEHTSSAAGNSTVSKKKGTRQAGFGTRGSSSSSSSTARRRPASQQQQDGQQHRRAISDDDLCPCCSRLRFKDCCQPVLDGAAVARSAPEVVRARITAALLGDVSYLVTTTHADSVLALGGSRNMRSLYRRECSMFKSNKMEVVGMAHCRGDLDGTWVVLSILHSTVGEFAGVKAPSMSVLARQHWHEGPSAAHGDLFADSPGRGSSRQYNNNKNEADDAQQWMFLKSTNEFPDNPDAGVLVELLQQHVPELLNSPEDDAGWQGHQQSNRMTGRQMCFIWDTPRLGIGFGGPQNQAAADVDAAAAAVGMHSWYVDLLQPAAEKFSTNVGDVDVHSRSYGEEGASPVLMPPGVFCMDDYLAAVAAQQGRP